MLSFLQRSSHNLLVSRTLQAVTHSYYSTQMGKRVAVVLAGCGVYDGSEIHEASAVLVHLSRGGASVSLVHRCDSRSVWFILCVIPHAFTNRCLGL